jgi:hypothetical protein
VKRLLLVAMLVLAACLVPTPASASSGHFIAGGAQAPVCSDIGLQVECSGKAAGLDGTTFEVLIEAQGVAEVECVNPAGNRAPGQDTTLPVDGTTGPLATPRNGQSLFTVTTDSPAPMPSTPTCPNEQWTAVVVDVAFTSALLTLLDGGTVVDEVTVAVG